MTPYSLDEVLNNSETTPQRVVSLVPSYTESLFALGFGRSVVGITDYCIHPASELQRIARIGGPKDPRITDILALNPDLVLCNQEENSLDSAVALAAAGINVWASFPKTVQELIEVLWGVVDLFRDEKALVPLRLLEDSVNWATITAQELRPVRYFCPIWQEHRENESPEWITFNHDTYMDDLLTLYGGINVFSEKKDRYPRVTLEEVCGSSIDLILLPDDPYAFHESDCVQMMKWVAETPAGMSGRIYLVDGSLVTWYGTRLGLALNELPRFFSI